MMNNTICFQFCTVQPDQWLAVVLLHFELISGQPKVVLQLWNLTVTHRLRMSQLQLNLTRPLANLGQYQDR
jgi:hypothetical protein